MCVQWQVTDHAAGCVFISTHGLPACIAQQWFVCRLHEALELVKDMARSHRYIEQTLLFVCFKVRLGDWDLSRSMEGLLSS